MVVGICLYALWTMVLRTGRVYSLRFIIRNFQLTLKASKAQFRFSSAPYRKRLAVVTKNKHKRCKIIIFSEISGIIKQAFLQKLFTLTWTQMTGSRTSDRPGCFYHPCLSQILTVWIRFTDSGFIHLIYAHVDQYSSV